MQPKFEDISVNRIIPKGSFGHHDVMFMPSEVAYFGLFSFSFFVCLIMFSHIKAQKVEN